MKQTINYASQFRAEFDRADRRTTFSYDGLGLLFDFLEECDPDYELDVIQLCCEYNEDSAADIARNYSIDIEDLDDDEVTSTVREHLEQNTILVGETATGFIYAIF